MHTVKLTANFERNLEEIETFLLEAEASHAFDALLNELTNIVVPNLARFHEVGRKFLHRPARSMEGANGLAALTRQLDALGTGAELRELVMTHYLLLYACIGGEVYLLSIRHHRQLSFDFPRHWPT